MSHGLKMQKREEKREETFPNVQMASWGILKLEYTTGLPANADAEYKRPEMKERLKSHRPASAPEADKKCTDGPDFRKKYE